MGKGRKKGKVLKIVGLAVAALAIVGIGLSVFMNAQMKKIPAMTAQECLEYTLKGSKDGIITVGTIKDGVASWHVYGTDGVELEPVAHTYEIGSLTKTMTATMIAQAVSDGLVELSAPIDCYLDLPQGSYPTISELLTHTSGYKSEYLEKQMVKNFFKGYNAFYRIDGDTLLKRASKVKTGSGEHDWEYSNFGFALLGQVLESVYEMPYSDIMASFLAEFGMENSRLSDMNGDLDNYWEWGPNDAYMSAGAVLSTIEDMLKYAQIQLEGTYGTELAHQKICSVEASSKQYDLMDIHIDAMGMGWILDEHNNIIWHNGGTGSYNSYLGFDPESQTAVVVLSNLKGEYRIPATVVGIKLLKELQD